MANLTNLGDVAGSERQKLLDKIRNSPRLDPEQYAEAKEKILSSSSLCIPNCEICGGAGWIRYDVPRDDPRFGKLEPCPNRVKKALTSGDPLYGLTLEEVAALDWSLVRSDVSEGHKAVHRVRMACEVGHGMIFLWGNYGQAKTLLLKIAVAHGLRKGREAAYANVTEILDNLRASYDSDDKAMTELINRSQWWAERPILAIDELDKANETDWVKERLHLLLDRRWVMAVRKQALTVIASNTSPDHLDGYLSSRIEDSRFAGSVIHLDGPDGRKMMEVGDPF